MSLRNKVICILCLISAAYVLSSYLILNHILYPAFDRLEQQAAEDNLKRAQHALAIDLQHIADIAGDWGYWDDAYEFAGDRNRRFIESNLADGYITELGFNLILFFNNDGGLIWDEFYPRLDDKTSAPLQDLFPGGFTPADPLLRPQSSIDAVSGLISTPSGPMMLASVPLLPTSKQGPRRGVLVLGSLIDERRIAQWRERARADIELLPVDAAALPVSYLAAYERLSGRWDATVDVDEEAGRHALSLLRDIGGTPLLMLRVSLPRAITGLGEDTIRLSLLLLILAGSTIMLITWLLLRKLMLVPVIRLTRHIQSLKHHGPGPDGDQEDSEQRLHKAARVLSLKPFGPPDLRRDDEIGQLARAFELMQENLLHAGRQIWRLAYQDSLTGLPNRRMFMDLIGRALDQARGEPSGFALLFLDLDDFKRINDTLGHDAGDQLLAEVATRLQQCIRTHEPPDYQTLMHSRDVIARLGGDEFVVFLSGIDRHGQAGAVARRILAMLARPLALQRQMVSVGVSIGITLYPTDGSEIEQLLKSADHAMYLAKQQGKHTYCFCSDVEMENIASDSTAGAGSDPA